MPPPPTVRLYSDICRDILKSTNVIKLLKLPCVDHQPQQICIQVCCLSTTLAYSLNFLYLLLTFEFFALVRRSIRLHTTTVQNTYIKHDVPTHSQT